jgi:hypothetical protein
MTYLKDARKKANQKYRFGTNYWFLDDVRVHGALCLWNNDLINSVPVVCLCYAETSFDVQRLLEDWWMETSGETNNE